MQETLEICYWSKKRIICASQYLYLPYIAFPTMFPEVDGRQTKHFIEVLTFNPARLTLLFRVSPDLLPVNFPQKFNNKNRVDSSCSNNSNQCEQHPRTISQNGGFDKKPIENRWFATGIGGNRLTTWGQNRGEGSISDIVLIHDSNRPSIQPDSPQL